MKKNSLIILICLVVLSSCVTTEYWKLKIDIPRRTELDVETFDSIIITPFLVDEEFEEFDLSREISSFFEGMLKRKTKNNVITRDVPLENEAQFESLDFWKKQESESDKTLFLTGTAQYSSETRKALLKKAKKRYEDPFPAEAKLEQRIFFNFNMTLFLIDAESGEAVFKREYKETESYNNPNQTSYYAFFDLIQQIQEKLLRSILGLEQVQERYLVIK
ncbi:hypothetical protein ACFLQZ_04100 [Acidobacteriota bacterium]